MYLYYINQIFWTVNLLWSLVLDELHETRQIRIFSTGSFWVMQTKIRMLEKIQTKMHPYIFLLLIIFKYLINCLRKQVSCNKRESFFLLPICKPNFFSNHFTSVASFRMDTTFSSNFWISVSLLLAGIRSKTTRTFYWNLFSPLHERKQRHEYGTLIMIKLGLNEIFITTCCSF